MKSQKIPVNICVFFREKNISIFGRCFAGQDRVGSIPSSWSDGVSELPKSLTFENPSVSPSMSLPRAVTDGSSTSSSLGREFGSFSFCSASSFACSMHNNVSGMISRRSISISFQQTLQMPYVPSSIAFRARSTSESISSCMSVIA